MILSIRRTMEVASDDFFEGRGSTARAAGKRMMTITRRLNIPKHEKIANSRMAVMRLTRRDPNPMTVVKTASAVGKLSLENVEMTASPAVLEVSV